MFILEQCERNRIRRRTLDATQPAVGSLRRWKDDEAVGKQDGLYWDPAVANGEESPFGPHVAEYLRSGHKVGEPYYGYYFRVLTRQGNRVPGGRYNYVINGNMIAGFALVAFPAQYGNTGVMTFVVSHHGKVYQKDLGPRTAEIGKAMQEYNPDATWTEVK